MSTTFDTRNSSVSEQGASERRHADLVRIFVHGDSRRIRVERRQNSIPVTVERRGGEDRREGVDRREKRHHFKSRSVQAGLS